MTESKHVKGKVVIETVTFEPEGTFTAINKARDYLKDNGFAIGSMCRDMPIGFAPADEYRYISKWRNMTNRDRSLLSGVIVPVPEFREGGARIEFFVTEDTRLDIKRRLDSI